MIQSLKILFTTILYKEFLQKVKFALNRDSFGTISVPMLKLSKLTDYSVVLLVHLSRAHGARMSASQLSQMTKLPEPTVSKILKILSRGNIVTSTRGASGGYALEMPADRVSILRVIEAMEGPVTMASCVDDVTDTCSISCHCTVKGRWDTVNDALKKALGDISLASMMPQKPQAISLKEVG